MRLRAAMEHKIDERFFLFLGSLWNREAATQKLQASGVSYKWKRLDSSPENWQVILAILEERHLAGVVGKLSAQVYNLIASDDYRDIASGLFQVMGRVPHALFVHEAILLGEQDPFPEDLEAGTQEYFEAVDRMYIFDPPDDEVRHYVERLFDQSGITVTPYRTNAEMSVLATAFVDDSEKNLLFRVYVPSGRLYAAEADELLSLFQDWLTRVGRQGVRQDGYRTAAGQVYEFFGEESLTPKELSREFNDFSKFLDLCVDDTSSAVDLLSRFGIGRPSAANVVTRYSKTVRRLRLDMRQEREARMLAIRHQLESELLDFGDQSSSSELEGYISNLIPTATNLTPMNLLEIRPNPSEAPVTVNINQQFIHAVESSVIQNVQGTVSLGVEARELLSLIEAFGGSDSTALTSAVHELEDPDAQVSGRLQARQRLKQFLFRLGSRVEESALAALQSYLQSKFGL